MKNCVIHGTYSGKECVACRKMGFSSKDDNDQSFTWFFLKTSFFLIIAMGLGWYLVSI